MGQRQGGGAAVGRRAADVVDGSQPSQMLAGDHRLGGGERQADEGGLEGW